MPTDSVPILSVIAYNLTTKYQLVAADAAFADVLPVAVAINDTVEPMSWESLGGNGSLRLFHRTYNLKGWVLLVRQTADIQAKVADALTQMAQ